MSSTISKANYSLAVRKWVKPKGIKHTVFLSPLLAIHEAQRDRDKANDLWLWTRDIIIDRCQELIWQMTGEWKARRGVTMCKSRFWLAVKKGVKKVATCLNKNRICSMRELGRLDENSYMKVVDCIESAIILISKTRKTGKIEPVLGSKVLHHFFPSVVPVYDDAFISKRVMKLRAFEYFINNDENDWVFKEKEYEGEKLRKMREFHHYFAFCAQQVCDLDIKSLNMLRLTFMKQFIDLAPRILGEKGRKGIIGYLDAKLAEYCLIGATYRDRIP